MTDPRNITEATTLAELRDQRRLLDVVALRVYRAPRATARGQLEALLRRGGASPGSYSGTGSTPAAAIEAACAELRRAQLQEIDA